MSDENNEDRESADGATTENTDGDSPQAEDSFEPAADDAETAGPWKKTRKFVLTAVGGDSFRFTIPPTSTNTTLSFVGKGKNNFKQDVTVNLWFYRSADVERRVEKNFTLYEGKDNSMEATFTVKADEEYCIGISVKCSDDGNVKGSYTITN